VTARPFVLTKQAHKGCQIFLGPNIPNWRKCNKWSQTIPEKNKLNQMAIHKIFQMVMKYANIFHSKALQNLPKLGIFGLKTTYLATLANK
jgi:hypothetical protein